MKHKSGHGSGVRCKKCGINHCPKGYILCRGCQMVIRRALWKRDGDEPPSGNDSQRDESPPVDDDSDEDDDESSVERIVERGTD